MSVAIHWRNDTDGTLYAVLADYTRLEYMRAEGKVGFLTLTLPAQAINPILLRVNMRLEPWRTVGGMPAYLDGESAFFLQDWGWYIDDQGRELLELIAYDGNFFLDWHNCAYFAGDSQVSISGVTLDDAVKQIVRDNLGADATDTARDLSAWLSVQANLSAAPTTTRQFSRRQVLAVLQDMLNESYQQGTYLAFDTVYTGPSTMEFRTYTGQRGVDHGQAAAQPVILTYAGGSLVKPRYTISHSDEANYIYVGGQGTDAARVIKTASTPAAVGLNRREMFVSASNLSDSNAVQNEAYAALYAHRAKRILTAQVKDTEGAQYGVHFRYGDKVYAEYREGFDCHVNATKMTVDENGGETPEVFVRGEA